MAKNIYSLQLLRNGAAYASKTAAYEALESASGLTNVTKKDGVAVLARYIHTEGEGESQVKQIRTLVGYYAEASAMTETGGASSHMTIIDVEGTAADVEELKARLGNGVTTANTATMQLAALSGDSATAQSGDTSVAGAKAYTDNKVTEVVNGLDGTITADTGYYINKVDEVDGKISGTTAALPTVAAIGEAGKPITAVSQSLGTISATTGTVNAEYVNVTGSVFSSTTVQAALEEIETEYKAADAAIIDNASESANTLAKLEDIVNDLSADAKEYSIKQITTGLSTNVKEAWGLFDADDHQSGATISIYKDSAYKEIYLGTSADTINTTTGEITKQKGDKQSLNYAYMKADGTYDLVKVDVSAFLSENEFASGVTATDHIVHGVVDSASETFLTVGAGGFKLSGVQDAIDSAYEGLDATVTGATSGSHITISIEELDGKLVQSGLTITEDNIADADDLAELSAKTVTEIASSNDSITAALSAATDGTKHLDIITDASKIQMSGFTSTDVLSGITPSSSITEAFKEVDKVITENEETVSAALNDLEESKVENIVVNGVTGTFNNKIASVTIDGSDVALSEDYVKATADTAVSSGDTIDKAIGKLEKQIENAVQGGLQQVEAGDGVSVSAVANNKQTITVNLKEDVTTTGSEWENPLKFDETSKGLYFDSLDCGEYN